MATNKRGKGLTLKASAVPAPSEDDWQAEDDARTLMRAHAIKSDVKRHAAAKAHAKKKLMQMAAIANEPGMEPAQAQTAPDAAE
jgi:Ulp1 family protease